MLVLRIRKRLIGMLRKQEFNMSEFESEWLGELNRFPTVVYSQLDGEVKASELGMTYEKGILHFSQSEDVKEIDVTKAKDILVRQTQNGLIIELLFREERKETYAEYEVDMNGQTKLIDSGDMPEMN